MTLTLENRIGVTVEIENLSKHFAVKLSRKLQKKISGKLDKELSKNWQKKNGWKIPSNEVKKTKRKTGVLSFSYCHELLSSQAAICINKLYSKKMVVAE